MKRPTHHPPIGLCTLSPRWSADPEPAIPFSHWSVVSHPKSRDFWLHDVISGHVTSSWACQPYGQWFPLLGATQQPIRRQKLSTNQKPAWGPYGRNLLLVLAKRIPQQWRTKGLGQIERFSFLSLYTKITVSKRGWTKRLNPSSSR